MGRKVSILLAVILGLGMAAIGHMGGGMATRRTGLGVLSRL